MPGTTLGQNEIFKFKNALKNIKMVLWLVMKPSYEENLLALISEITGCKEVQENNAIKLVETDNFELKNVWMKTQLKW